jgi:hypothetical protein
MRERIMRRYPTAGIEVQQRVIGGRASVADWRLRGRLRKRHKPSSGNEPGGAPRVKAVVEISGSIDRALEEKRAAPAETARSIALTTRRARSSTHAAGAIASRSASIGEMVAGLP